MISVELDSSGDIERFTIASVNNFLLMEKRHSHRENRALFYLCLDFGIRRR